MFLSNRSVPIYTTLHLFWTTQNCRCNQNHPKLSAISQAFIIFTQIILPEISLGLKFRISICKFQISEIICNIPKISLGLKFPVSICKFQIFIICNIAKIMKFPIYRKSIIHNQKFCMYWKFHSNVNFIQIFINDNFDNIKIWKVSNLTGGCQVKCSNYLCVNLDVSSYYFLNKPNSFNC